MFWNKKVPSDDVKLGEFLKREEAIRLKELDLKLAEEEIKRREMFLTQWREHEHNWHDGVQKFNEDLRALDERKRHLEQFIIETEKQREAVLEQKDDEIAYLKETVKGLIEALKTVKGEHNTVIKQ